MKIAVTGATGFIGGHVVRALQARGERPILVVRPGRAIEGELAGLPSVAIDFDQPDQGLYERLGQPDALIHLAWGGLPHYRSAHHTDVELPMQRRLLETLLREGLPRLVVAGTCFEYGMQSGELAEDMPTKPDNPYGQAKDLLRQHLESLQQQVGFQLAWARLFYMFGEDQSPKSLYPLLRSAAMRGDAQFPMSGGEQVRDFLPMAEVADRLARLAFLDEHVGVVNVCSGEPTTVLALVQRWIAEQGWSIQPKTGVFPYPDYEPMAFWGSRRRYDSLMETR